MTSPPLTTTQHKGVQRFVAAPLSRTQDRDLKPCGTTAAYARHLRHGEVPCRPCVEANTEQKKWHNERRQLRAEVASLRRQVVGGASRGWICDIDGCWNLPLQDCLACQVAHQIDERKAA